MKNLVVANWKMNPESLKTAFRLCAAYRPGKTVDLAVCPPAVFLSPLFSLFGKRMAFGAQDGFWESQGPFTGENSLVQLKAAGSRYVILGHSERRKYFGEDDTRVNKKVHAALKAGLTPVVCLGGGLAGRVSRSQLKNTLSRQLSGALKGLKFAKKLVLVCEPSFAISTFAGKRVTADEAADMAGFLRKLAGDRFGFKVAAQLPILYGGSVNGESFQNFLDTGQIDGFLVGAASLRPKELNKILRQ